LGLVKLSALMERTSGRSELKIGLIDGPVLIQHPGLADENVHEIPGKSSGTCTQATSAACVHGTFVAGILSAKRGMVAPAICPDCTLLVRPIFAEANAASGEGPSARPDELNICAAIAEPATRSERALEEALNQAAWRGVIAIVAAGNQGTVGSTAITRHPWVIPVVGYDLQGRPMNLSNLGSSIGRRGLGAPGDRITSLGTNGNSLTLGGTSVAAPFVTGAVALLWSEFPSATANEIRFAATQAYVPRRTTVVPPLLDAWAAYQAMRKQRLCLNTRPTANASPTACAFRGSLAKRTLAWAMPSSVSRTPLESSRAVVANAEPPRSITGSSSPAGAPGDRSPVSSI
jgi:subtilisin family serine protease